MPRWNHTINLNPEWKQAKDGEISISTLIDAIIARFKHLPSSLQEEVQSNLDDLKSLQEEAFDLQDDVDANEFDEIWREIYDWADEARVWLNTF